ncbi:COQ9 family protein [Sphingomonas mesophila]|uniref:COQ9 family protein n=1 Tax=Sphingomonas mesophila TaxID=2303576 RepID=UPI000E5905D8|nr:COQ9 family protein [Sphingomonas mesophila]
MTDAPTPLQAIRDQLALAVGENAVFDGWSTAAVEAAAQAHAVDPAKARLAFGKDPAAMVEAYAGAIDAAMAEAFPPDRIAALKIRDRITELLWFRFQAMLPAREAVRSGLAILARPDNALRGARLGWRTADRIWRLAGDTATDFNHYTKRLTLGAVYSSTLLVWLDDDSEGLVATRAFLDRRIADVMRFEKWKAQWRNNEIRRPSLSRFLGRLRYPPA